jgi:hypothetical protein
MNASQMIFNCAIVAQTTLVVICAPTLWNVLLGRIQGTAVNVSFKMTVYITVVIIISVKIVSNVDCTFLVRNALVFYAMIPNANYQ